MTASQSVAIHRRLPGSTAILVGAGFAIGSLFGLGVQGALDRATANSLAGASQSHFAGVAVNNMSDAARHAIYRTAQPAFGGVAVNNMSDAARRAVYATPKPAPFSGVSDNNMSDAARQAVYGDAR